MTPSPQQAAFFDWIVDGDGSAIIVAVAGSGKTTTLIGGLERMQGTKFFGAFNKKIVEEIARRVNDAKCTVSTMHSAGLKALRRNAPQARTESHKVRDLWDQGMKSNPAYKRLEGPVIKLVSLLKQCGCFIIDVDPMDLALTNIEHHDLDTSGDIKGETNDELVAKIALRLLHRSNEQGTDIIDFDDMLYLPLLWDCTFTKYDWVLIDEAQDTNTVRRMIAERMVKPRTGRLVAVGDPHQAIYGFTGADSTSLDIIKERFSAIELPLTVTYRCPKRVVEVAQQWVSHIEAHESAPDGVVTTSDLPLDQLAKPGDAVLCRFNAPLVRNVYAFIGAGVPAQIEGRDIGLNLKNLARRMKADSIDLLLSLLDDYEEREKNKHLAKGKEGKAQAVEDQCECLRVIVRRVLELGRQGDATTIVCNEIDNIFVDGGPTSVVLFSSIHKSKGREWHKVVWLQMPPSPYAKLDWQSEQEKNLNYVAVTRAKHELVIVPFKQKERK